MRTPAQALRDAIASGAVEAWNRGERIQHREERAIAWDMWECEENRTPSFSNPGFVWRPAPAKRRIPFTQATVPKGALWRYKDSPGWWFTPVEYFADGIGFSYHKANYNGKLLECEYSTDGGVTWKPGSQEVES